MNSSLAVLTAVTEPEIGCDLDLGYIIFLLPSLQFFLLISTWLTVFLYSTFSTAFSVSFSIISPRLV